ncbi:MAG: T9SS type A sorting domain-containing protein [Bacteroidales bacterium]|nr:T9SS type A sorting domain-containing protein [Bacteroidales bacterium]MDD3665933.1 T9SS type A sorting domain-containing protein [Bacteroidales bacterium]
MRSLLFVLSFVLLTARVVLADNWECSSALPFCLETPVTFSATTGNISGELGPFYACLGSQPNPSWLYCKIGQSGSIEITITSNPSFDIDFICWGPFSNPNACGSLTEDKVVDCSFSASVPEICNIPNGVQGQYYYLMLTNYSAQPTQITLSQTNGTGTTDCSVLQLVSNNGPLCVGDTLELSSGVPTDATFSWTGPAGFTSTLQNPVINNVTALNAGWYFVNINNGGSVDEDSTLVEIYSAPSPSVASNNGPVCTGSMLTLFATTVANAGYHWTGPNGFESSVQNPVVSNAATTLQAGVYTLTAVNPVCNCPSSPSYTTVVVNSTTAPVATSNGPICEGEMLTLNATTVAGATYQWTGPNGFTSNQQNPVVASQATVAMTGQYSVVAILNGCESTPSTVMVTVNPVPSAPLAGYNSPVCEGYTLSLTATYVAGGTYNWTGPNGFISSIQSPVVTTSATAAYSGLYEVTVTVNGCMSPVGSVGVVVEPAPQAPVASNNGPVCEGAALMLEATTIGDATYSWTGPNNFVSTEQNPTVSLNAVPTQSGLYEVRSVSMLNGCYSLPSVTPVEVNPEPIQPVVTQDFHSLHSSYASEYQWYLSGQEIPGATNQDYFPVVIGSYKVQIADEDGCENISEAFWFEFVGEQPPGNHEKFVVYPIPSTGRIEIYLPENVNLLKICDLNGKEILVQETHQLNPVQLEVQKKGIFVLQIDTKQGIQTKRIVIL